MKIKPLRDRILVRLTSVRDSGKLFVPTHFKTRSVTGEIISCGAGKMMPNGTLRSMSVKIADKIVFGIGVGKEIKSDNKAEELLMLFEEDILGIVSSQNI